MDKTKYTFTKKKTMLLPGIRMAIVSVALLAAAAVMIWNTSGLKCALEKSTEQYAEDVAYQLTSDISARMAAHQTNLRLLANSLTELPKELTEGYLERQAQNLDFDSLNLLSRDGTMVPANLNAAGWGSLPGIQASFEGESSVGYVEGQNLLFSVPVESDGEISQVLVGVRGKENMQALIQPESFSGKGLTCIVDSSGQVIISPTDLKPFLQLDNLFQSEADMDVKNALIRMQSDMEHQRSGVFPFTAVDETRLVMSYSPLGVNGWVLLTLVPADLISGGADAFLLRSFLIVGGIVLVFTLFLTAALSFYRANQKRLEEVAFTDPLTGGMNHAAFQLEYQGRSGEMEPDTYTMVFLNVKGFKLINESFGTQMGNKTIQMIYQVLKSGLREGEMMARADADHFFLCLNEVSQEEIRRYLAEKMEEINSLSKNIGLPYGLTILQGACRIDRPDQDLTLLEDRARAACKLQGEKSVCCFYSEEMTRRMQWEQELNGLFDDSLRNHDFQVYLQPKVRLSDGNPGGAEALVRWIHPQRGMIYPSDFIPLFEKNENICRLDLYVWEEICILLKRWREEGRELIPISVNLSRVHFRDPNYLRPYIQLKEKYQIPDGILEFELTESVFFDEQQRELVKQATREMHRHGFLCSLDDFGVGFSSLALLKEFEVDAIKLDRQFFEEIENEKAQSVIASFIELAERIGIQTVAEGIETPAQLDFLRRAHCDLVQGYIYSKPLPMPDFESWMAGMTGHPPAGGKNGGVDFPPRCDRREYDERF